jgi:hypothetical protein
MQPETTPTHQNLEHGPDINHGAGIERPVEPDRKTETGLGTGGLERFEQAAETRAAIADNGLTTTLPVPVIGDLPTDDTASLGNQGISGSPVIAGDDDLIEKEWVDKAKKIVAETKDDPYRREEQVSKLQADYIKKRYGRELGAAE